MFSASISFYIPRYYTVLTVLPLPLPPLPGGRGSQWYSRYGFCLIYLYRPRTKLLWARKVTKNWKKSKREGKYSTKRKKGGKATFLRQIFSSVNFDFFLVPNIFPGIGLRGSGGMNISKYKSMKLGNKELLENRNVVQIKIDMRVKLAHVWVREFQIMI